MKFLHYWEVLSNNGIASAKDFEAIKKTRIINQFCIIGFSISLIYTIFLLPISPYLASFDFFNVVLSVIIFVTNKKYGSKLAADILFVFAPIGLISFNYVYGRQGAEYYFFPIFILSLYIHRFGWRSIANLIYLIALFFVAKYLEITIIPTGMAAYLSPLFYYTSFIMAFVFGYLVLRLFAREYENNKIEMDAKNKLLEESINESNQRNSEIKLLMKELSHRTKNNLQLISSLINIQTSKIEDKETKEILIETKNRIVSIALIHKKLYQNEKLTVVYFKEYILDLIEFLLSVHCDKNRLIEVEKEIDDFEIKIDLAVSLGLIMNELITNSIKYGLLNNSTNQLKIKIKKTAENCLEIRVSDSGYGIMRMDSEELSDSFGSMLIKSLVKQLNGKLYLGENQENCVRITLNLSL